MRKGFLQFLIALYVILLMLLFWSVTHKMSTISSLNSFAVGTYKVNEVSAELEGTAKATVYLNGTLDLAKDTFSESVKIAGDYNLFGPSLRQEFLREYKVEGSYKINGNIITVNQLRVDGHSMTVPRDQVFVGSLRFDQNHIYLDFLPFENDPDPSSIHKYVKVTLVYSK